MTAFTEAEPPPDGCSAGRLVDELGGNAGGQVDQLVGRLHIADDGRQVALQLELPLHHALDRVELLSNDFLPPAVWSHDDELGLGTFLGGNVVLRVPALPVP